VESDNPCPTGESIYNLCDADWVFATFKDNFVLKLRVAALDIQTGQAEKSHGMISALAKEHGMNLNMDSAASLKQAIDRVFTEVAIYASKRIVEKVETYAKTHGKKVLCVLSYSGHALMDTVRKGKRFDQAFVDYLDQKKLPYVDLLEAHLNDFASTRSLSTSMQSSSGSATTIPAEIFSRHTRSRTGLSKCSIRNLLPTRPIQPRLRNDNRSLWSM